MRRDPPSRSGRPPPRRSARSAGPAGEAGSGLTILYGAHPVIEALRNPARVVRRILATANAARRIEAELGSAAAAPHVVRPDEIDRLLGPDAVHQGFYLEAEHLPEPSLDDLGPDVLLLALDQVTDPHNVGAIVRSAAAFGVAAIVTTARHSPAATGVLAKSASGGLEHVPIVTVGNLGNALLALGERGFLRIGLDSDGGAMLGEVAPSRPAILVLGAEGKGLRERTKACCDVVARLDMPGAIKSLNVSNAAAVALYALTGSVRSRTG